MPDNRFYLDQIVSMEFKGVEWTREKILEVRDLLSPWNHNIALPHGVYTTACDDYYPAHREIMRIVRERLGSDFSGRRIVDIGCLEGYFSIECALQGAEVLGTIAAIDHADCLVSHSFYFNCSSAVFW